jgi:hypothetical protein
MRSRFKESCKRSKNLPEPDYGQGRRHSLPEMFGVVVPGFCTAIT